MEQPNIFFIEFKAQPMRWNPIPDTAKEAKNLGLDKPWHWGNT